MGWEAIFCLVVLGLIIFGLIRNISPDALLLGGVVLVTLVKIISPEEALAGFSSPAVLTVGALYVVAAALRETGALDELGRRVFGQVRTEKGFLRRMSGIMPAMSAFLNNTPIVAMFIPIVSDWCKRHHVAPSKLLIPLSYLCIFGGTCTLIGTSTNLVINGLMEETARTDSVLEESLSPMGFFELGKVGLPYAVIGILYMLFIGRCFLPSRKDPMDTMASSAREYLVNMLVKPECRLAGQTIEEAGLRHLPGLFLVEITREGQIISPVSPDFVLKANDILTFTGAVSTIVDLEKIPGLVHIGEVRDASDVSRAGRITLCEAVVSPRFPGVGRTIRDGDFRARYNAVIIAVHRGGQRLAGKVGDIVLRAGDTLLIRAGAHFMRANRNNPHFLLVGGVADFRPFRYDKTLSSLLLLVLLVILLVTRATSIVMAAFLVAGLMVAIRCISIANARRSVDWRTLIAIASAFGMAKALVNSGAVDGIASFLVSATEPFGPYAILAAVYIMTSFLAATVTNNAAGALVFPFAVAIAVSAGLNPRTFVMMVAFAASASFISPLGYQTNLMVYGPGGYKVMDFVKVGLPLNILLLICATILVPIAWPF
jgi:di/tricarboxylate transporter